LNYVIGLVTFLPGMYVAVVFAPGVPLLLAAIPVSGLIALVAGSWVAVLRRERSVLWLAVPVALSHLYFGVAAMFFAGQVTDAGLAFWSFMIVELALVVAIVAYARSSRLAAILVGWFTATYALAAGVLTGSTLTGNWP
jgi:hypothetical protein